MTGPPYQSGARQYPGYYYQSNHYQPYPPQSSSYGFQSRPEPFQSRSYPYLWRSVKQEVVEEGDPGALPAYITELTRYKSESERRAVRCQWVGCGWPGAQGPLGLADLERHVLLHLPELRPYRCSLCAIRIADRPQHLERHFGEQPTFEDLRGGFVPQLLRGLAKTFAAPPPLRQPILVTLSDSEDEGEASVPESTPELPPPVAPKSELPPPPPASTVLSQIPDSTDQHSTDQVTSTSLSSEPQEAFSISLNKTWEEPSSSTEPVSSTTPSKDAEEHPLPDLSSARILAAVAERGTLLPCCVAGCTQEEPLPSHLLAHSEERLFSCRTCKEWVAEPGAHCEAAHSGHPTPAFDYSPEAVEGALWTLFNSCYPSRYETARRQLMDRLGSNCVYVTCRLSDCLKKVKPTAASLETHALKHFPEATSQCGICQKQLKFVNKHYETRHPGKAIQVKDLRPLVDIQLAKTFTDCYVAPAPKPAKLTNPVPKLVRVEEVAPAPTPAPVVVPPTAPKSDPKPQKKAVTPAKADTPKPEVQAKPPEEKPVEYLEKLATICRRKGGRCEFPGCGVVYKRLVESSINSHVLGHAKKSGFRCTICGTETNSGMRHAGRWHANEGIGSADFLDLRAGFQAELIAVLTSCFPDGAPAVKQEPVDPEAAVSTEAVVQASLPPPESKSVSVAHTSAPTDFSNLGDTAIPQKSGEKKPPVKAKSRRSVAAFLKLEPKDEEFARMEVAATIPVESVAADPAQTLPAETEPQEPTFETTPTLVEETVEEPETVASTTDVVMVEESSECETETMDNPMATDVDLTESCLSSEEESRAAETTMEIPVMVKAEPVDSEPVDPALEAAAIAEIKTTISAIRKRFSKNKFLACGYPGCPTAWRCLKNVDGLQKHIVRHLGRVDGYLCLHCSVRVPCYNTHHVKSHKGLPKLVRDMRFEFKDAYLAALTDWCLKSPQPSAEAIPEPKRRKEAEEASAPEAMEIVEAPRKRAAPLPDAADLSQNEKNDRLVRLYQVLLSTVAMEVAGGRTVRCQFYSCQTKWAECVELGALDRHVLCHVAKPGYLCRLCKLTANHPAAHRKRYHPQTDKPVRFRDIRPGFAEELMDVFTDCFPEAQLGLAIPAPKKPKLRRSETKPVLLASPPPLPASVSSPALLSQMEDAKVPDSNTATDGESNSSSADLSALTPASTDLPPTDEEAPTVSAPSVTTTPDTTVPTAALTDPLASELEAPAGTPSQQPTVETSDPLVSDSEAELASQSAKSEASSSEMPKAAGPEPSTAAKSPTYTELVSELASSRAAFVCQVPDCLRPGEPTILSSFNELHYHILSHTRIACFECPSCGRRVRDAERHADKAHPGRRLASFRDVRAEFNPELTTAFHHCFGYKDKASLMVTAERLKEAAVRPATPPSGIDEEMIAQAMALLQQSVDLRSIREQSLAPWDPDTFLPASYKGQLRCAGPGCVFRLLPYKQGRVEAHLLEHIGKPGYRCERCGQDAVSPSIHMAKEHPGLPPPVGLRGFEDLRPVLREQLESARDRFFPDL